MRTLFIYLLTSLWLFATLPSNINQLISKSGISKQDISIYIKEARRGGRVISSLNANKMRTPASVIKVLTTYASVLKLGFNYRWQTKFYTTGNLRNGILYGDLLIKGFGDPTLNEKSLKQIVSKIRANGIRKITGNIVIDRSYFRVGNKDSSDFDNHPCSAYNAMPDAMMFNERISKICVEPRKNSVHKKYADGSYRVINQLQLVNRSCRGRYSWVGAKVDKSSTTPIVTLKGKISKYCGKRDVCKVITKPYKSFYYALKDRLRSEGITVQGTLKLRKIPFHAKELFTHYSESLEKIISKTAKKSNNLYARHLLLLLGAKVYGAPATVQKGRDAVVKILSSKGALGSGMLNIDNGSGLSRVARVNATLLANVLDSAYSRYKRRWLNTLSIAGVDGTIKRRFRGTVVHNRAWMKTGTLKNVKNIAGYVKSRDGKLYTVVILVNSKKAKYRGAKLQNDIIKWLVLGSRESSSYLEHKKQLSHSFNYTTPTTTQNYYIQVGSFNSKPNSRYLRKIIDLGLPYKVISTDRYRVVIGPYKNNSKAKIVLKKVRNRLNSGAFISRF